MTMNIDTEKPDESFAPDPANTTAGSQQAAPKQTQGFDGAPSISDMLAKIGRPSELGTDGVKYIETLADMLKKNFGEGVTVAHVPSRILEVYRVSTKDHTILLTFSESYNVPVDTLCPPTEQIIEAAQYIRDSIGGTILNNIVVTPADYKEVSKMFTHITSVLKLSGGELGQITINSFAKGRFSISTNINDVRENIKKFNPKALMPRTDIGLVLYLTEEVGAPQGYGGQPVKRSTPILVIGGYTSFVSTAGTSNSYAIGNNAPGYLAIVKMTTIASPLMSTEMISLAIPLATEEFIRRNGWLKPYTKFGKKDPNLGSLIPDEKGKPFFIDNMTTLMDFATKNIAKPYLAIEVTDGYARIPGIEGLRYGTDAVQKGIANFLGVPESQTSGELVYQRFCEYIGEITETGTDTREVDYINLIAAGASDLNMLLRYLYIPSEPHKRAELIARNYDIKALYTNATIVLNADYVDNLSTAVAAKFRPLWEQNVVENNIGVLGTGNGNNFSSGPAFGIGPVSGGWNGFTMNPFG